MRLNARTASIRPTLGSPSGEMVATSDDLVMIDIVKDIIAVVNYHLCRAIQEGGAKVDVYDVSGNNPDKAERRQYQVSPQTRRRSADLPRSGLLPSASGTL